MEIAPQKQFLRYGENCFYFSSWEEIASNRRILMCSITRFRNQFLFTYMQYLDIWARVYTAWGIDDVYFVTTDKKFDVMWVNTMARSVPVLGDVDCEFVRELGKECGFGHYPSQDLSKYWNYQVLLNQGEIEKIYFQPMDQLLFHLLKDTKDINLVKNLKSSEHLHLTPYFLRNSYDLTRRVLYYRLHPNMELKNYLLTTIER